MEVVLKQKIHCLLLLVFIMCAMCFSSISVMATTKPVENNTLHSANYNIKVNRKIKVKKILSVKKSELKGCSYTTSNSKVANVSAKGVITGLKKGTATITVTKADGTTFGTINLKVKNRYNKSQLRLMSAIIYSEAGAECYAGKKAVGIVVMNRIESKQFPNDLKSVIYQPYQFSPARNGSLNKSLALYDSGRLNKKCIKAAKATLNGDKSVSYKGRTIDMNSYLFFSGYINGCRLQIQNHQFK